ncbi:MAG TPA: serine/threonine-protein kinase, partial [Longimicrobium sp.]|nr:serine/threonine-protein kinase [Longimicrobium sp.]
MAGLEQLLIGRTLDGRYDVEEVLGTGRSGSVYRARHNRLGSEVAIKVVSAPRKAETRERYRRLFRREAALAAGLRHPNLPLVIGSGTDPETDLDFFVTELLEGERLSQVLAQRGRPPATLALRVFADAVAGVAAAHAVGMLHRDLRPANLYLVRVPGEKQKRVRVLGFGVPQIVRRDTMTSTEMELIGYSPPELFAGGRLTPASDVFGIGAIGWQLLVGSLPYDDAARRDLAVGRPVALRVPPELDAVPPHVAEAIVRALRPDPAERFADVAAFAAALDGRAEPETEPAAEPAAAEPVVAAPIIVATQPAPVAAPVEAAPMIVATQPAPVAPVEAAPIIVAAEPEPVAAVVEAVPIVVAAEPAPVVAMDPAPIEAAAVVAAIPVVVIAAEAAASAEIAAEPEIVASVDAA